MLKLTPIIPLAATAISVAIITPVQAGVNRTPNGEVISITQLLLPLTGGDIYVDILFRFDSFNDIFGDPNNPNPVPFFFNNLIDGQIALTAINSAINEVSPIPQLVFATSSLLPPGTFLPASDYVFPVSYNNITGEIQPFRGFFDDQISLRWTDGGISPITPSTANVYARFTQVDPPGPAVIPEPSSLIGIMVTGFSLLMGKGKRD